MNTIVADRLDIHPDMEASIEVIRHAGAWLQETKGSTSKWWDPEVVSVDFLAPYVQPDEFIVAFVDGKPAATATMLTGQPKQEWSDWTSVDGDTEQPAVYIDYVATEREFAGQGLVKHLIDYAVKLAEARDIPVLRLDTAADNPRLCELYESLGFVSVNILDEADHRTVLYERPVANPSAQA